MLIMPSAPMVMGLGNAVVSSGGIPLNRMSSESPGRKTALPPLVSTGCATGISLRSGVARAAERTSESAAAGAAPGLVTVTAGAVAGLVAEFFLEKIDWADADDANTSERSSKRRGAGRMAVSNLRGRSCAAAPVLSERRQPRWVA